MCKECITERTNEQIVSEIQEGKNVEANKAALCEQMKHFITYCTRKYLGIRPRGDDMQDYEQAGYMGILEAINSYDPSRVQFSSYAAWYIRKNLYECYRHRKTSFYIPRNQWAEIAGFQKTANELRMSGQDPTYENIEKLLGIDRERYEALKGVSDRLNVSSLDKAITEDPDGDSLINMMASDDDTEAEAIQAVYAEQVRKAYEDARRRLSERQASMIDQRYFEELSLEEISENHNCKNGTTRQSISEGLLRMGMTGGIYAFLDDMPEAEEAFNERAAAYREKKERFNKSRIEKRAEQKKTRAAQKNADLNN